MDGPANTVTRAFHDTRSKNSVRASSSNDIGHWCSWNGIVDVINDEHAKRDKVHDG